MVTEHGVDGQHLQDEERLADRGQGRAAGKREERVLREELEVHLVVHGLHGIAEHEGHARDQPHRDVDDDLRCLVPARTIRR